LSTSLGELVVHIEELKQKVKSCRTDLKDKMATFSESGPLGISIVDAIVAVLESQELRIVELESQLSIVAPQGTFPSGLESKGTHDQAVALQQVKETAGAKVRDTLDE
jgi:hypothetical protein